MRMNKSACRVTRVSACFYDTEIESGFSDVWGIEELDRATTILYAGLALILQAEAVVVVARKISDLTI